MSECQVCGSSSWHSEHVSEVFNIDGKFYLVESIPAMVCERCGEQIFSRETTEKIRLMLHDHQTPLRSVSLDVFSFETVA